MGLGAVGVIRSGMRKCKGGRRGRQDQLRRGRKEQEKLEKDERERLDNVLILYVSLNS